MEPAVSSLLPTEDGANPDSTKLVGSKRQQVNCSSSNVSPRHLVYVRRKLETEHRNSNVASTNDASCSPMLLKSSNETERTDFRPDQPENPKDDKSKSADGAAIHVEREREGSNYWSERFNRLQEYLKNLQQSGLKDYADYFRTYPVEDLNKHAIELEKRAIRLSIEEAVESQRVKDLNLLGKSSQ
ncbi:hypothetical protein AXF42_Ash015497 [Apostasia shenzhenica]|uniref:Uncharacterized protein n=1 Tax=Apostasia shenzhenica TaxID=1088818 RepID=A0A2H9ZSD8_9ASPA|nr:hypothetical protein AXF42_Ash015497 [Apostasia shenzhenica]